VDRVGTGIALCGVGVWSTYKNHSINWFFEGGFLVFFEWGDEAEEGAS
jgi:hypothetical protein